MQQQYRLYQRRTAHTARRRLCCTLHTPCQELRTAEEAFGTCLASRAEKLKI